MIGIRVDTAMVALLLLSGLYLAMAFLLLTYFKLLYCSLILYSAINKWMGYILLYQEDEVYTWAKHIFRVHKDESRTLELQRLIWIIT